jgi:hypothetical protein
MKKVRLILAAAACCVAGIGVFAKSTSLVPTYYISATSGIASCVTTFTSPVCPIGSLTQCSVQVGDDTRWVSRLDDTPGAQCVLHMRN